MTGFKYIPGVATLKLDGEKCAGCGMCAEVCPHGVFIVEGGKAVVTDRDLCMECGACAMNCPFGALSVRKGVGCAEGIIKGAIRGTGPSCDCGSDCC